MENKNDNIELRSDKVRSIIGQIPPWIIRSGISVIFLVIVILLTGSYFYKYPYTIKTTVVFDKDNSFVGEVKIPANEIFKVKKGQEVEIYFNNVKSLNGLTFKSVINDISKDIIISDKTGFYTAKIDKVKNLNIHEETKGEAIIKTDAISFFERMIKPFKMLKKNKE